MVQQTQLHQLARYRAFMNTPSVDLLRSIVADTFTTDSVLHVCHPFGDLVGADSWSGLCLSPLLQAMPDLERRDMIVVANLTDAGALWVGCMGNYFGTLLQPFLDIPPTGHLADSNPKCNGRV